jgi:hypothetical protein
MLEHGNGGKALKMRIHLLLLCSHRKGRYQKEGGRKGARVQECFENRGPIHRRIRLYCVRNKPSGQQYSVMLTLPDGRKGAWHPSPALFARSNLHPSTGCKVTESVEYNYPYSVHSTNTTT